MVETVSRELGANSRMYQKLDDMASAIGLPINNICKFCWTGQES